MTEKKTYREKQFKCELCEKVFSTSGSVTTHKEINLNVTFLKKYFQYQVVKLLTKKVKKDKNHLNNNKNRNV